MINVEYIDHMGNDLRVANAARVSFKKRKTELDDKDIRLLHYLAKHKHKSPFNHTFATFYVKAPIFVARQLVKHEYMPWNEVSRRYVEDELEFYFPNEWRTRPEEGIKQGSGASFKSEYHDGYLDRVVESSMRAYSDMLKDGIAPEMARMVLPANLMTEWYWSGTLYAYAKMCALRLDPHAQYESQLVAQPIDNVLSKLYPHSWAALKGNVL